VETAGAGVKLAVLMQFRAEQAARLLSTKGTKDTKGAKTTMPCLSKERIFSCLSCFSWTAQRPDHHPTKRAGGDGDTVNVFA
jgi:hypothetical protein